MINQKIQLGLFAMLAIPKYFGLINLNWWWVTAPLWGPVAFVVVCATLAALVEFGKG